MGNNLSYEITREETRSRNATILQILRIVLPGGMLFGLLYAWVLGQYDKNLFALYSSCLVFFLAVVARTATVNRYFPYARRSYSLKENGIIITKGKRTEEYPWEAFANYFISGRGTIPDRSETDASQDPANLPGGESNRPYNFRTTFYLKKKTRGLERLIKDYVVVYGEPDNAREVDRILARRLPYRKTQTSDDIGLIRYEFK